MARYANLVEESMQLVDDGGHLLRQVAGIHCEKLPAAKAVVKMSCGNWSSKVDWSGEECWVATRSGLCKIAGGRSTFALRVVVI